ncbi:MAG: radical SAM protein [Candidatus Kapabacteria bacterium]|nr:radical SAM protein [Candidatus Kapabacteria bacterium]
MIFIPDLTLNISEIFYSIQGEGSRAGMPCIFIRLQGCKLRCSWCDTAYALKFDSGGKKMTLQEIKNEILEINCNFVEFTGGEPLEQLNVLNLMEHLLDLNYLVAVETAGYLDICDLDKRIVKILDFKCPDSKMSQFNLYSNIQCLTKLDEIKFVIASHSDYIWAKEILSEYNLNLLTKAVFFSFAANPSPEKEIITNKFSLSKLAELILEDNLPVRLQLQMHKYVWEPNRRGV